MPAKVWKLMKGRWAGITTRGKRISIAKTKAQAESRAGISSRSRTTKSKTKRRKKSNLKRRVKRTAKRTRRGGKSLQTQVFKWLRIAALIAPAAQSAVSQMTPEDKIDNALWKYTGYSIKHQTFDPAAMVNGWGPFLMTCLATYGIPKIVGIIRRL